MPSLTRRMIVGLAACLTVVAVGRAPAQAPAPAQTTAVGAWNTISDKDGKPEAVVEIREVNGELVGTVTALLVEADPQDSVCGKCSGERKDQRIVGMEILRHMRPDGSEWSGGEILDPETGKTYKAKMKLTDDGTKLVLRGYIGISLFGRSQTWVRRQ
jgi:uncharacterized protein (DUF2147 family)